MILSTLPSAGVEVLADPDGVPAMISLILIGIILLIGIGKKNGIKDIDFAIAAEAHRPASHLRNNRSARRRCCRFRPIMMTTMAAMLGGVPLMLGTGTGSEIRQPLGYAAVGGLDRQPGAATVHTTPVIYLYLDKLSNAFSGWGRTDQDEDEHTTEPASVKEAAE